MQHIQPLFGVCKGLVVILRRGCGMVGENFCEVKKKSKSVITKANYGVL